MEWFKDRIIGRGSSATVSLAATPSGELFAVKSCELSCSNPLQKEKNIISQLNSPYIVKYLGFDITCEENKPMYNLFLEYASDGTLSDMIKKHHGGLNESFIKNYAYGILRGLDYLHSNGVVHCDIKPQNILIVEDGSKIADFGCAKLMMQYDDPSISGTPVYMAPEVAIGQEQGFAADIWALGCTILEMATGSHPWSEVNDPVSAIYRIGYSKEVPETPTWFSSDAKEFLSNCFRREANERWTAKQLLQHPLFNGMKAIDTNATREVERSSPTSILDRGIWDSFEVSEASTLKVSSFTSPSDKIRQLIGDAFSSSCLNFPNWTDDEDWLIVRGIEEKGPDFSNQKRGIKQDRQCSVDTEPCISSSPHENELESSVNLEDTLVDYFTELIDVLNSIDIDIDEPMSCESVPQDFVSSTVNFECNIMKNPSCSMKSLYTMKLPFSHSYQIHIKILDSAHLRC